MTSVPPDEMDGEREQRTALILDWCGPFAARVLARIHEYDDAWPKQYFTDTVVPFDRHLARQRQAARRR